MFTFPCHQHRRGSNSVFCALVTCSVVVLMVVLLPSTAEAKRGCDYYGHSCYGGMGKRTSYRGGNGEVGERAVDGLQLQAMTAGRLIDNIAAAGGGGGGDQQQQLYANTVNGEDRQQKLTAQQVYNLSPFLRQWLRNERANQEPQNISDV